MRPLVLACLLFGALAAENPALAQPAKGTIDDLNVAFQKASAFNAQAKYAEAIPFLERAAALAPTVFGPEHLNTAAILNNLGVTYNRARQPKKAAEVFKTSLAIREKVLGKNHDLVGDSLSNLALALADTGDFAQAEKLYLRCLHLTEEKHGKDHPDAAITANNLAVLYFNMGRLKEAEPLLLRTLQFREARLGKDHPTWRTYSSTFRKSTKDRENTAMRKPMSCAV